jgi:hypothetical protein
MIPPAKAGWSNEPDDPDDSDDRDDRDDRNPSSWRAKKLPMKI